MKKREISPETSVAAIMERSGCKPAPPEWIESISDVKPPWQLPEGWPKSTTPTSEDRAGGRKAYAVIRDEGPAPAALVGINTGHTVTETLRHLRYLESVHVVRTATDETGVMRWQPIPQNRWEIHAPF